MKNFLVPFASDGDTDEIPDNLQSSGNVSFQQGYGYDYERDQESDSLAKNIERKKMNYLFGTITEALQHLQIYGTWPYITAAENGGTAFAYAKGARVSYEGHLYESLTDGNQTLPTDGTNWRDISASAQNWAEADHTHAMAQISGLLDALANKSNLDHTHALTALSGILPIANGGTGATTAANARTNLGLSAASTSTVYVSAAWSSSDKSSWYIKFSNGWIIQSGTSSGTGDYGYQTINLFVAMANSNYFVSVNPLINGALANYTLTDLESIRGGIAKSGGGGTSRTTTSFLSSLYADAVWIVCGFAA